MFSLLIGHLGCFSTWLLDRWSTNRSLSLRDGRGIMGILFSPDGSLLSHSFQPCGSLG